MVIRTDIQESLVTSVAPSLGTDESMSASTYNMRWGQESGKQPQHINVALYGKNPRSQAPLKCSSS